MKTKSRVENIMDYDLHEVQKYKSVDNNRMAFRVRTQMVNIIPGSYKNKYKLKRR